MKAKSPEVSPMPQPLVLHVSNHWPPSSTISVPHPVWFLQCQPISQFMKHGIGLWRYGCTGAIFYILIVTRWPSLESSCPMTSFFSTTTAPLSGANFREMKVIRHQYDSIGAHNSRKLQKRTPFCSAQPKWFIIGLQGEVIGFSSLQYAHIKVQ
jgi:hypothetical protein